jgi:hypothetical protein
MTEPGAASLRGINNIPAFEAYDSKRIEEFSAWWFGSKEAESFQTLVVDSLTNVAEHYLTEAARQTKHGMQAYGMMAERTLAFCTQVFHQKGRHAVLICKQALVKNGTRNALVGGELVVEDVMIKRPYFPGNELNIKVPHLFDNVIHLGKIKQGSKEVLAFTMRSTASEFARCRFVELEQFEEPNFLKLFSKIA